MPNGADDVMDGATPDEGATSESDVQPESDGDDDLPFYTLDQLEGAIDRAVQRRLDRHFAGVQGQIDRGHALTRSELQAAIADLRESTGDTREVRAMVRRLAQESLGEDGLAAISKDVEVEKLKAENAQAKRQQERQQQERQPQDQAAGWNAYFWNDVYPDVLNRALDEGFTAEEFERTIRPQLPADLGEQSFKGYREWKAKAYQVVKAAADKRAEPKRVRQPVPNDRPAPARREPSPDAALDAYISKLGM